MLVGIEKKLYTPYLDLATGIAGREKTKSFLEQKHKGSNHPILVVDGSNFTEHVLQVNDDFLSQVEGVLLLEPTHDAVVATTKNGLELACPVGDCGLLVAHLKDVNNEYKLIGNAHLGYKGVLKGMLENFLDELMETAGTLDINEFELELAPMAGENFELPLSYFNSEILPFIEEQNKYIEDYYKLDPTAFITKSHNSITRDRKVYFKLRTLIIYLLQNRYKVSTKNLYIQEQATTNPKNILSSFRSHSLAKNIPEKVMEDMGIPGSYLNIIREGEGMNTYTESDVRNIMNHYEINYQQAELLLYGTAEHYQKNNSRLSLNILTREALEHYNDNVYTALKKVA